eukprot:COSAG02_NODE_123_length_35269_cov_51.697526_18_plen_189_part_00
MHGIRATWQSDHACSPASLPLHPLHRGGGGRRGGGGCRGIFRTQAFLVHPAPGRTEARAWSLDPLPHPHPPRRSRARAICIPTDGDRDICLCCVVLRGSFHHPCLARPGVTCPDGVCAPFPCSASAAPTRPPIRRRPVRYCALAQCSAMQRRSEGWGGLTRGAIRIAAPPNIAIVANAPFLPGGSSTV